MPYRCERPDFGVIVEGGFVDTHRWFVHAVLEYRAGLAADARSRLEAEARLELMLGVVRESRRGRDLGARRVVVLVEGDREVAGFFEVLERRERAAGEAA